MLNYKRNGDIYFGRIKVYNGYRQSPVGWVRLIMYALGFAGFMAFLIIWLSV